MQIITANNVMGQKISTWKIRDDELRLIIFRFLHFHATMLKKENDLSINVRINVSH